MKRKSLMIAVLLLVSCEGYKRPSLSSNPQTMSADGLCFRDAYAQLDAAMKAEIAARNLDCDEILESQPPPPGQSEF